jgi:uncharacterized protein
LYGRQGHCGQDEKENSGEDVPRVEIAFAKVAAVEHFGGCFFDLEDERDLFRLQLEWDSVIARKDLVVFDEAQMWPELFSRLRVAIDRERGRMGRFLLLGSVAPVLMTKVSESLAGRLSVLELTPFILPELDAKMRSRLWFHGGYPGGGVLDATKYPQWQKDYLYALTQRDLPLWGLPAKPQTTNRLVRMLAAVHGQAWNASQIGQSMGLDHETISSYADYLAGAFLIRRLPPYQTNIRKRLVKTPKIYWRDSGLLHAVQNVADRETLLSQPWVGASWEGFVIEQGIGVLTALGKHFEPYYFRTNDQRELDLVLDFGKELWAVEIKLTSSPSNADVESLNQSADLIKASRRVLVSQSPRMMLGGHTVSCGIDDFLKLLQEA